jgi:tRNA(Ile)-lysidine synthase
MLERFREYIKEHQLLGRNSSLLIAVSGGMDSVVLTHLVHAAGYDLSIAHCNFQLRGKESDEDEEFIRKLALHYGARYHSKQFHTTDFASDNRMGIQEAARKLRYSWFMELAAEHAYDCIVTAHHADDLAETVILNLTRGTGIAGLHGILPRRGKLIRPLLFATRREVSEYAERHKLAYREDSSNMDIKYARNRIRRDVMPVLSELNPNVVETMVKHASIISDVEALLDQYCLDFLAENEVRSTEGSDIIFNTAELLVIPGARYLLYRLLKPYGFNPAVCGDIFRALNTRKTGEVFYSERYKAVHDRDHLVVIEHEQTGDDVTYTIHEDDDGLLMQFGSMEFTMFHLPEGSRIHDHVDFSNNYIAYVDADKVKYPLEVRTWRKGDQFRPYGMKGKKLISDFFTDIKMPLYMKSRTYLVLSGGKIIWVAGHRVDERVRITDDTNKILKMRIIPQ